jgi:hypothetical protein
MSSSAKRPCDRTLGRRGGRLHPGGLRLHGVVPSGRAGARGPGRARRLLGWPSSSPVKWAAVDLKREIRRVGPNVGPTSGL